MGTVRYRPDRKVWFIEYVDARGCRVREVIGPGKENERLARKVLEQREAEAILGQHRVLPAQTPQFAEYADDWLRRQRARGLRPKTIESYESTVNVHLRPAFGGMRLGAIGRGEVENFVTTLRETGTRRGKGKQRAPLSVTTVNYALSLLKFILTDAVEQEILRESPAARVKPLRSPDRADGDRLQYLRPDEIERLLDVAEEPFRGLYRLAIYSGMRRGELLAIRWPEVDLHTGCVYVRRTRGRAKDGDVYRVMEGPVKTRASRRAIDVPRSVLLGLPGSDVEGDYVFRNRDGGPLDPDNVDRTFTRHLTLAGLPEIRFHDLRHTHATLLIAAGVHPKAIQVRMGHASITTTLNTYGHLMPSAFQGVGERLDALVQGTRKAPTAEGEEVGARKP